MSLSGNASTDNLLIGNVQGLNSIHGKSAYELAVIHGFEGTEEEWIASLKGEKGDAYILTEADKEEIADKVAVDNLQESAEKYIDSVIEEKDLEVTRTATGSAITIKSANAPLQNLKLYGKTTQDGTELKSVGDSGSFEVGVYGKNILDITKTSTVSNGVTIIINTDKSITYNGTATSGFSFSFVISSCYIPKGNYKMLGNGWSLELIIPNKPVKVYNAGASFEVVEDGCKIYPYRWFTNGSTYEPTTIYPMLVLESVTDETYEPCNKQSITFTDTLRGVGEVADEKDFARGVTTQRFAKSVFNGSEIWQYHETRGFYSYLGCKVYGRILTNLYPTNYGVTPINKTASTNFGAGTYIWVKDTAYSDIDSFKSALATNPLTVVYEIEPLETPISETELNAYRQLMTNSGTTTILSEADMTLDYYVNKPNAQAIGNIHSQINKDYFKLQQAIIETGGN